MNRIVSKEQFSEKVFKFVVEAPLIAKSRRPGNFVIFRIGEKGERVPLTIAEADEEKGTITLVVQKMGVSTHKLCELNEGDYITDVVGPLGQPTHIENFGTVICAGGGVGIAPMLPIAQALKAAGNRVIAVLAGRSKELIILEEEMRKASDELIIMTDDGSYGTKGLVTQGIESVIQREKVDKCFAIGPAIMMKFVCLLTKKYEISTDVSLNTIMVDGTGMCGACRVTIDGQTKFVCVDGPEFDGHKVDFDEMMKRMGAYKPEEMADLKKYEEQQAQAQARPAKQLASVDAIDFADIIFVTTITNQHESIAQMIAPYVRDHQMIVLIPGYMGSLIFKRYINKQVVYCEWETTAYNGRIMDNSFVRITFYNPRNAISVLPLSHKDEVLATLSQLFDNTRYFRKNILESALHNPNMIVHPIGILFSVARIEYSKGEYWMYKEGYSPSVLNVIQAFDESKNAILERFGCEPLNYFEAAKWRNELSLDIDAMDSFWEFAECSNKGPSKVDCRYINEDVPMGLGLIVSLGKVLGIDVSIQQSIFTLAGALTQKDFSKGARTIQYLLGKDDVTFEDIASAIEQ